MTLYYSYVSSGVFLLWYFSSHKVSQEIVGVHHDPEPPWQAARVSYTHLTAGWARLKIFPQEGLCIHCLPQPSNVCALKQPAISSFSIRKCTLD